MNVYMSQTDWYVMSFFAWFGATVLGAALGIGLMETFLRVRTYFGRTSVHNV
jgi:hypothetical protein